MGVVICCCRRFLTLRFWGLLVAFLQQTLRRQTHRLNNSNHLITTTNFFIFITLHDQEGHYENRDALILNKFFPSESLTLRKFNMHPGSIQYCFQSEKIVTRVQYTCLSLVKLTTWWNHTPEKTLYFRNTNSKKRENSTWKKRQRAVRRGSWVENERTRK